jgi:hypothetical protein
METPQVPPQQQIMQLLMGKVASQALTIAAELGIADAIGDGARPIAEIAKETGGHEDGLYRILRALAAVGVFSEQPNRHFANNATSATLRTGVEGSTRALVRWIGDETSWWTAWGKLSYSAMTGKPAFDHVHGCNPFEFFGRDQRVGEIFHGAMTDFSRATAGAVAEAYDFSGIERLVDVGGGHGFLLTTILRANPKMHGVLFDLPEVVGGADATLHASGQAARVEKAPGNFFDGVVADADAYIMKHIIHDWDDARSTKILEHCRKGLRRGGKVLIVDQVITDRPESAMGKLLDLEMLVMTPGGRERTEAEFAALAHGAGLRLTRIVPTKSPVCVVELSA